MTYKEGERELTVGETIDVHLGPKRGRVTVVKPDQIFVEPNRGSFLYAGESKNGMFIHNPIRIKEPVTLKRQSVSASVTRSSITYQGLQLPRLRFPKIR